MIKVMYVGDLSNAKVKLPSGTRQVKSGQIIEITEIDWASMSTTGNFELYKEIPATEDNKKKKIKKGGGKK